MDMDDLRAQASDRGFSAGTWAAPTDPATAALIIAGYDDGDPQIMEMCPSPLSGENAGDSMVELGLADIDQEELYAYEEAFEEAFWGEVLRAAQYQVGA